MPARKKAMEIGQITNKNLGVSVALYLDRDSKEFWAEFSGSRYTGKTAEEVEKQVQVAMTDSMNLEWLPMITLKPVHHSALSPQIQVFVEIERSWVAQFPDRSWRSAHWMSAEPKDSRASNARPLFYHMSASRDQWNERFHLPWTPANEEGASSGIRSDGHSFLPYTKEHWDKIEQLIQIMSTFERSVPRLLASPEHLASFIDILAKLSDLDTEEH